jgi:hypothetical protein
MPARSTHLARAPRQLVVALITAGFLGAALADTQTWNYKSYIRDRNTGQYNKEKFLTSTVTVTEKDGKAAFRMITAGRGDPCISASDLPAEVERGADTLTVTVTPPLAGCEPFRYVIKNDGSGGIRQIRRDDRWVPDGFDHDLTAKK